MNKRIILLIFVSILLATNALGLGVSPGKIILDFEPNMETTLNLMIINNEQKELSVVLNAEGPLSQYITFDQKDLHIQSPEGSKTVSYKIKLPANLNKPGLQTTNIVIRETKEATEGPITIGASLAVVSILGVNVPYQDKYAEARIFVVESNQGEESIFVVELKNLGEKDINSAIASIDIFENGNKVGTATTDERSLKKGTKRELIAKWTAPAPGTYQAKAKVNYDGKLTEAETSFTIGGFFIKLIDIAVNNFHLGGIAKFNILKENIANQEVNEVYTKMTLDDETGNKIMDIETPRKSMSPQERKEFNSYWDTEKVDKGIYHGKLTINADGKVWENSMTMDVDEDSIETKIGTPTGMVVADTGSGFKQTTIITVLLLVLIIINIGWFAYFRRQKR